MEDPTMLDQIVNLIINNGVGVACIAYFMFRDYKFMQKLSDAFASLKATLESLEKVNSRLTEIAGQVENNERSNRDDN
jgi:hypothetical protein